MISNGLWDIQKSFLKFFRFWGFLVTHPTPRHFWKFLCFFFKNSFFRSKKEHVFLLFLVRFWFIFGDIFWPQKPQKIEIWKKISKSIKNLKKPFFTQKKFSLGFYELFDNEKCGILPKMCQNHPNQPNQPKTVNMTDFCKNLHFHRQKPHTTPNWTFFVWK